MRSRDWHKKQTSLLPLLWMLRPDMGAAIIFWAAESCSGSFLKEIMEQEQLSGTILYLGCPAEENAAGESYMIEEGFFDQVDAAFSWHPHYNPESSTSSGNHRVYYTFHGTSAHASRRPILDAARWMPVN